MLSYEDVGEAIEWLERAFGFRERADQRYTDDEGRLTHAELELDGAMVMLGWPAPSTEAPNGTPRSADRHAGGSTRHTSSTAYGSASTISTGTSRERARRERRSSASPSNNRTDGCIGRPISRDIAGCSCVRLPEREVGRLVHLVPFRVRSP
jgi:hypothetical protein